MKRYLAVLLSVLLLATAVLPVSANGSYNDDEFNWGAYACTHSTTQSVEAVASTCATPGHDAYTRCVACGVVVTGSDAELPLADHTPGDEADCKNAQTCTVCGAEVAPALDHEYLYACDQYCYNCGEKTNPRATHNAIHHEAKKAVNCIEYGNKEYWQCEYCGTVWLDEAGRIQTNIMSVRIAGECVSNAPACQDGECVNCGLPCGAEVAHNVIHVAAKDATCIALGNIEYWYCDICGQAWLDAECTLNTNLMAVNLPMVDHTPGDEADCENAQTCTVCGAEVAPALDHEYLYACDQYCYNCGEKTNPRATHNTIHHEAKKAVNCIEYGNKEYWQCEYCGTVWLDAAGRIQTNIMSVRIAGECVSNAPACQDGECVNCGLPCGAEVAHNVIHVAAKDATCIALGNIEYWYCDICGQAWLDAECTLKTNLMAVNLPMVDHIYDDDRDADCNVCGFVREVATAVPGDANGDGSVNNRDVALLQQYINKWDVSIDTDVCDVNNDGYANNRDVALMQQYINKWDVELV